MVTGGLFDRAAGETSATSEKGEEGDPGNK